MIYFTADHHFGHKKISEYSKRPFTSVEEMDEVLIKNWNTIIKPEDTVYHLGDFTLGSSEVFLKYRQRLFGDIYFVLGGHDTRWAKGIFLESVKFLPQLITQKIDKFEITLCHYPLLTWDKSHYGSLHLHGHCHGSIGKVGQAGNTEKIPNEHNGYRVDVGVDCWDYFPTTLEQIFARIAKYKDNL